MRMSRPFVTCIKTLRTPRKYLAKNQFTVHTSTCGVEEKGGILTKTRIEITYLSTHHRPIAFFSSRTCLLLHFSLGLVFLLYTFFLLVVVVVLVVVRIRPTRTDDRSGGAGCSCQEECGSSCPCRSGFGCGSSYRPRERRLRSRALDRTDLQLCECSDACACAHWPLSKQCTNRVALLAPVNPTLSLEVFKTESMGFGLRSLVPVKKGSFVCRYLGQYVREEDCQHMSFDRQKYLWKLHLPPLAVASLTPLQQQQATEETLLLDAGQEGNESRFVNHHCDPNLLPTQVYRSSCGGRTCEVALFARKDIAAKEQMFLNYHYEPHHSYFRCDCGPSCVHASGDTS